MFGRTIFSSALLICIFSVSVSQGDYKAGVAEYEQKNYSAAEIHFAEAAETNPNHAGSHFMLGLCQERTKNTHDAVVSFTNAVNIESNNSQYIIALARALSTEGNPDRAVELLTSIPGESIDPRLRSSHTLVLARALIKLEQNEDALAALDHRLMDDPKNPFLHQAAGVVFNNLGQRVDAFNAYARAFELAPTDKSTGRVAIRCALSSSDDILTEFVRQSMYDRATEIGAVLATNSDDPGDLILSGKAAFQAGQYRIASSHFEKAVRSADDDPQAWYYWGRGLAWTGDLDRALESLEQGLTLDADKPLTERIHGLAARIDECRIDLEGAANHHLLSGNTERAKEMSELDNQFGNALKRRGEITHTISGLRRTLPQLEAIDDDAGLEAIGEKITGLENELASIDKDLNAVRKALQQSCPG